MQSTSRPKKRTPVAMLEKLMEILSDLGSQEEESMYIKQQCARLTWA